MSSDRYLAHRIVHRGREYPLSVLSVVFHNGEYDVEIRPFEREEHSTTFHNGSIAVCANPCAATEASAPSNHFNPGPRPPYLIFF